ncbi:hypothetical protein ACLOJK_035626 [Asimina triloba]
MEKARRTETSERLRLQPTRVRSPLFEARRVPTTPLPPLVFGVACKSGATDTYPPDPFRMTTCRLEAHLRGSFGI